MFENVVAHKFKENIDKHYRKDRIYTAFVICN